MHEPELRITKAELALAEKVGTFLLPVMKQVAEKVLKPHVDATTKFCREFGELQRARKYIGDSESPMVRIEMDLKLLELASKFVAAQSKE